jgi:hypothetical protein
MGEAIANLTELQAFTYDHCSDMITDNIYHKHVMWMAARENERPYNGGEHIRELLRVASDEHDQTGGAVDRTGAYEIREIPMHDAARYRPRYYVQTIPLWDADVADNGGSDVQYWDFVSARMSAYMMAMKDRFSRHFYGKSGGGLQINGLGDIFENDTVFGQIDRSDQPWWRSHRDTNTAARAATISQLAGVFSAISDGDEMPDTILTSTQVWDKYENILDPRTRYNQNMTLANMGFEHLSFRNKPIMKDKNADIDATDRHKVYLINWDHLFIRPHMQYNFKEHNWMRMPKYLGQYMLIVWFGNVTANSLRRQGTITDINPAL